MKSIASILFFLFFLQIGFSQDHASSDVYSTSKGAIDGYDPVAYFTEKQAVKGQKNIMYEWQNAQWHFASEENKAAFIQDTEKYAPQYGGYCAYGWAQGYAAKTEGTAWSVVENKLYLNYNSKVKSTWDEDQKAFIKKADAEYQKASTKKGN